MCNGESSGENEQAFLSYTNHPTCELEPEKTRKVLVKEVRRGDEMIYDERLFHYLPNAHKSPIGITDLNHPIKKPRPFFDATFRPAHDSIAINNITSKETKHPLIFPEAFTHTMEWLAYFLSV